MGQDDGAARSPGLTAAELDALRPYVVDLEDGILSGETGVNGPAQLKTTRADVAAIFATHLPAFAKARGGGAVPVVFWAHGGMNTESFALATAQRVIPWWLANGIYPLHFVWHTGLWDTLGDILAGHASEITAAVASENAVAAALARTPVSAAGSGLSSPVTDFTNGVIEALLRRAGGPAVWAAMKDNARRASEPGGGAALVAEAFGAFLASSPGAATAHAAGFSAGANFHANFIPAVVGAGAPMGSCSLLAPALDTAAFKEQLMPLLGKGIARLAIFGMNQQLELADNCYGVYRSSLLYLIRAALDEKPGTPILGLQQCIREDEVLDGLFTTWPATGPAEAVWAVTVAGPLDSRSAATSHFAFDDDVPTMDSVARRILGRDNIVSFGVMNHAGVMAAALALPQG